MERCVPRSLARSLFSILTSETSLSISPDIPSDPARTNKQANDKNTLKRPAVSRARRVGWFFGSLRSRYLRGVWVEKYPSDPPFNDGLGGEDALADGRQLHAPPCAARLYSLDSPLVCRRRPCCCCYYGDVLGGKGGGCLSPPLARPPRVV